MRALPHQRGSPRPPLLARATAWLLDPPAAVRTADSDARPRLALAPEPAEPPEPPSSRRPIVAVLGLAPRAGASTIARALAARLAALDLGGAAVLHTPEPPRTALPAPAASRLARAVAAAGLDGVRAAGRLCLLPASEPLAPIAAQRAAPLVADVAHGMPADGAVALSDHVVLVCPADLEPALALAVEAALRGDGHAVTVVLNRVVGEPPGELAHALAVPEARLAAQLTVACRDPRGALGAVAAELAERSVEEAGR
jgi:hypothetical protein